MILYNHNYTKTMNKLNHIIRRHKSCVPENTNIFNKKIRQCSQCKYSDYNDEKCKKFGEYEFIYGKYQHLSAVNCRRDEKKCGESAVFYEEITQKELNSKFFTWMFYNWVLPVGISGIVVVSFRVIVM